MTDIEYRIEHDTMGEVRVPRDALYAAQTQRAVENFPISGDALDPAQIVALARIKKRGFRVGRVELPGQDVSVQPAELGGGEVGRAAGDEHRLVHDALGHRHGTMLDAGEQREPLRTVIGALVDVAADRRELGRQGVVHERHLGDAPADVGILAVGEPGLLRRASGRRLHGQLESPTSDPGVHRGQQDLEDAEDAGHERIGVRAGREAPHDAVGRCEGAVQSRRP